jgi:hypothetical protein
MRRLLTNLTLFLLPLVLLLLPGFVVLHAAGEFMSFKRVGRLSRSSQPLLAGPAYTNYLRELKTYETNARRPEVLVLGSSRAGQFRSGFLKDPAAFYNASLATNSFISYRYFIESMGASVPDVVIVDMLQPYFGPANPRFPVIAPNPFGGNGDRNRGSESDGERKWRSVFDDYVDGFNSTIGTFFRDGAWWKVYADYAAGKYTLGDVFNTRDSRVTVIGLRALTTSDGTRNDGSDRYGKILTSHIEQRRVQEDIAAMVAAVSDDAVSYDYGPEISSDAIEVLRQFLQSCKDRGIFVIGFLPPMPPALYKAMQARPNAVYAQSFRTLPATLRDIYTAYGFDFYDFEDPSPFGGSDREMVNPTHGSEKMYLRFFIEMAENSLPLGPFVDVPSLKTLLQRTAGDYEVFPLESFAAPQTNGPSGRTSK